MTAVQTGADSPPPPLPPPGLGASLKSARERAGLSLDDVAQALKLAPRQVRALEEEDFAQLPGRTFARGFVRNYARLLKLDGDDLLAQLPDPTHAPALAAPSLHSTSGVMGEVPVAKAERSGRWLIPVLLLACVVAAGAYEWYRSRQASPAETVRGDAAPAVGQAGPGSPGTARSDLPNPLSGAPVAETPAPQQNSPVATQPAAAPEPQSIAPPQPGATEAAAASETGVAAEARVATALNASAETEAPLVLTYRASSWTQVRDGKGQVLLLRTVPAGSEQAIRGTPPFDIVIGNARAVAILYRGKPVDLARYTRQNIARLRLQ